ncbi:RnfH family protein [Acinetobacter sp. ANC 3791]|uniref:RnfH family protein n=1 Tax=Acinetobacter sp. ANC 3791 TaxID=2529836 RepID=UPI00103FC532|nr:RnfH family protein [Acinetobacter sp. ANC 3791]TCB84189.1 RnfH family protein [Acinetobacter sp. ANC 3791]
MQQVWVAYATTQQQYYITVEFQQGMTVQDAIEQSGLTIQTDLPQPLQVGIFGVKVSLEHALQAGDRVEIYRPLLINPQDIRRNRAANHPVGRYQKGNRFKRSS